MYCLERGIPLPPLGSFQYNLITEQMRRSRAKELSFAKFLATFLQPLSGMSESDTVKALADYGEEINQLTYNYNYESIRTKIERVQWETKLSKKLEERRLLDKVTSFSAED